MFQPINKYHPTNQFIWSLLPFFKENAIFYFSKQLQFRKCMVPCHSKVQSHALCTTCSSPVWTNASFPQPEDGLGSKTGICRQIAPTATPLIEKQTMKMCSMCVYMSHRYDGVSVVLLQRSVLMVMSALPGIDSAATGCVRLMNGKWHIERASAIHCEVLRSLDVWRRNEK